MLLKQKQKQNQSRLRSLVAVCLSGFFYLSSANAAEFSLGVSYPDPMGSTWQTLEHSIGVAAQGWFDASFLGPSWLKVHTAAYYDPYSVRNSTLIKVTVIQAFAGLQATLGRMGVDTSAFLALDIGVSFSTFGFPQAGAVTANNAMSLATQILPGIDVPLSDMLGVQLTAPWRIVFSGRPLFVIDPCLSVRIKL